MTDIVKPSDDFEYYKDGAVYWNDFEVVRQRINALISGSAATEWVEHVRRTHGYRRKGLFISCGNGWVERECFVAGLIGEAVGFDVMDNLIEIAIREAALLGLPARYSRADGNDLTLAEDQFDLIVNNGSMHHIAKPDQMLRKLRRALGPGGIYVVNDYTGPHRNQYDWPAWSAAVRLNASLPQHFRLDLQYPHMPTMLHTDPTEAIHSEIEMEVTRRYFDCLQHVAYGGALAYILLYDNQALYRERNTPEGQAAIAAVIAADSEFTAAHPESNLFTFAVCTPKPDLPGETTLSAWSREEDEREAKAALNGKRYYPPTALELIYNEVGDLKHKLRVIKQVVG